MKNIILLFFLSFLFIQCSSDTAPSKDIEYKIDGVRFLLPKEYQKISSPEELEKITKADSLFYIDENLFYQLVPLKNRGAGEHVFAKVNESTAQVTYLILKTDGPVFTLSQDNADYFIEQTEKAFQEKFFPTDSTYYHGLLEEKLDFGFSVKYLKLKYFLYKKDWEWYSNIYLIYSNARTIGMTIISPEKKYDDLESYMKYFKVN